MWKLWIAISILTGAQAASASAIEVNACEQNLVAEIQSLKSRLPAHLRHLPCSKAPVPANPEGYLGPNCMTAVMLWFDAGFPLRFVNGDEFEKFLVKNFVQKDESEIQPGDVVVFDKQIPGLTSSISHAAVYLGDGLLWNKLGPAKLYINGNGQDEFMDPDWTFSSLQAQKDYLELEIRVFRPKKR